MIRMLEEFRVPSGIGRVYGETQVKDIGTLSHKNNIYSVVVVPFKHLQIQT